MAAGILASVHKNAVYLAYARHQTWTLSTGKKGNALPSWRCHFNWNSSDNGQGRK